MRLTEKQLEAALQLLHTGTTKHMPMDKRDAILGVINAPETRDALIECIDELTYGSKSKARDIALDLLFAHCRKLAWCFVEGDDDEA